MTPHSSPKKANTLTISVSGTAPIRRNTQTIVMMKRIITVRSTARIRSIVFSFFLICLSFI